MIIHDRNQTHSCNTKEWRSLGNLEISRKTIHKLKGLNHCFDLNAFSFVLAPLELHLCPEGLFLSSSGAGDYSYIFLYGGGGGGDVPLNRVSISMCVLRSSNNMRAARCADNHLAACTEHHNIAENTQER